MWSRFSIQPAGLLGALAHALAQQAVYKEVRSISLVTIIYALMIVGAALGLLALAWRWWIGQR